MSNAPNRAPGVRDKEIRSELYARRPQDSQGQQKMPVTCREVGEVVALREPGGRIRAPTAHLVKPMPPGRC